MTDTEKLQKVMELFENSSMASMDAELEGLKIHLEKTNAAMPAAPALQAAVLSQPQITPPAPASAAKEKPEEDASPVTVKAPLVGIFYASRQAKGEPLVRLHDCVEKNQPLCLIEAMKTMNELTSPAGGQIERILVQDGDMVEYGQPLFEIREAEA